MTSDSVHACSSTKKVRGVNRSAAAASGPIRPRPQYPMHAAPADERGELRVADVPSEEIRRCRHQQAERRIREAELQRWPLTTRPAP